MAVRITGLCRGDGKGYVKLAVGHRRSDDLHAVAVTDNGAVIPCGVYDLESVDVDNSAVVTVPLLDGTNLALRLYDAEAGGTTRNSPLFETSFKPLESKIRSRLFYRLHHDEAMRMRDIDQRRLHGKPYVYVTGIYPSEQGFICRFHATVPYEPGCDYDVQVLDAAGGSIGDSLLSIEDCVVASSRDSLMKLRELTYSVRLDRADQTVCIVLASHQETIAGGCFTCLLPAATRGFADGAFGELHHASQDPDYERWLNGHRATPAELLRQRRSSDAWESRPLISIVVPVFRPHAEYLREMIESVLAQSYANFELVLVNASGDCPPVDETLASFSDSRIRVITCENLGIAGNTNLGIDAAKGDYVAFVDHDDVLEPETLYRYCETIARDPQADVLYCDEDHLVNGRHTWPVFKPAFNPDLLHAYNYVTHMLMVSRYALERTERSGDDVSGAQDYDMTLRCTEVARSIRNVPHMLYHWREHEESTSADMSAKPYAIEAGRLALQRHCERQGLPLTVEERTDPCTYRLCSRGSFTPRISIVIPTKDHVDLLDACLASIRKHAGYSNYEVVCVENNSVEESTFSYYKRVQREDPRVRVITWPGKGFNYSAICNYGADQTDGELLLFLNNDTEARQDDWLTSMSGYFMRPEVGVVGVKLVNRDGLVQHGGIGVSPGGCFYLHQNLGEHDHGYMDTLRFPCDVAAITGACQMVRREVFDQVGGFDEELAVAYSDVDLCLKIGQLGLLTVFDADVSLWHRESSSRQYGDFGLACHRTNQERLRFADKWSGASNYSFLNPNLDQRDGHFVISPCRSEA